MIEPMSLSMPAVMIHEQPFSPYKVLATVDAELHGAHSGEIGASASFIGHMRDHNEGDAVREMWLEHYPGMTDKVLAQLCEQARRQYSCQYAIIHHRVGKLQVNEPIVLVAVWSAHRAEAFAACQATMEALKADAPFWKQETLVDRKPAESTRWVAGNTSGIFNPKRWSDF